MSRLFPLQIGGTNRVLMLSRLTKMKGAHLAVATVAAASERLGRRLDLRVVGAGPIMEQMRIDANRFNVSTEFLGHISSEYVNKL